MGKRIRSCGCGILVVLVFIAGAAWWGYTNYYIAPDDRPYTETIGEPTQFTVEFDDTALSIGERLEEGRVVESAEVFAWVMRLRGQASQIVSGEYSIPSNLNVVGVASVIASGPTQKREFQVTLLEGWTNAEMAQAITDAYYDELDVMDAESGLGPSLREDESYFELRILDAMDDLDLYRAEFDFLEDVPAGRTTEGFLFPDTYRFFMSDTPEDIVRRLLSTFEVKVAVNLEPSNETWFELITLAAMTEGESGRQVDNAGVAGVFRNRLAIGQRLESDATVNYATGKSNPRPTFTDLATESLYNTYQYTGLPYGPIGNPGRAAIADTINYKQHNYYYFIANLQTGETIFGRNAAEHEANIRQYLD